MRTGGFKASVAAVVLAATTLTGCGGGGDSGGDVEGTWVHPEEGTIVLEDGGDGSITQSGDPVPFEWELSGDTVLFSFEGDDEVSAQATIDGDTMTFRVGDFSGDEPAVFTRE